HRLSDSFLKNRSRFRDKVAYTTYLDLYCQQDFFKFFTLLDIHRYCLTGVAPLSLREAAL
ncbi:hypothetical protein, partial [Gallibacterium anatis]|uniref:hypothetical protein n=1 Tax=Gallibacterium anatis TaxID=750 RepID=UPI0030C96083